MLISPCQRVGGGTLNIRSLRRKVDRRRGGRAPGRRGRPGGPDARAGPRGLDGAHGALARPGPRRAARHRPRPRMRRRPWLRERRRLTDRTGARKSLPAGPGRATSLTSEASVAKSTHSPGKPSHNRPIRMSNPGVTPATSTRAKSPVVEPPIESERAPVAPSFDPLRRPRGEEGLRRQPHPARRRRRDPQGAFAVLVGRAGRGRVHAPPPGRRAGAGRLRGHPTSAAAT